MNVFIYARKSVFRKGSESIEVQIEECKRYLTLFRNSLAAKVKQESSEDNIEIFLTKAGQAKIWNVPSSSSCRRKSKTENVTA